MKQIFLILILTFVLSLFPVQSKAGPGGSGGGMGVVCRDNNNKIKSVELLDLWEARSIYGLSMPNLGLDRQSILAVFINTLKMSWWYPFRYFPSPINPPHDAPSTEFFAAQLWANATYFWDPFDGAADVRWLTGVKLKKTEDSFEWATPSECDLEQVVIYTDGNPDQIIINKDLFDLMSPANQAALFLHESLYKILRKTSEEKNSLRTRRLIGRAASGLVDNSVEEFLGGNKPLPAFECRDDNHRTVITVVLKNGLACIIPKRINRVFTIAKKDNSEICYKNEYSSSPQHFKYAHEMYDYFQRRSHTFGLLGSISSVAFEEGGHFSMYNSKDPKISELFMDFSWVFTNGQPFFEAKSLKCIL